MARVIGTPPLGWLALATAVAAHGAGFWGLAGGPASAPISPPVARFTLAMAAPRVQPTTVQPAAQPAVVAPPRPKEAVRRPARPQTKPIVATAAPSLAAIAPSGPPDAVEPAAPPAAPAVAPSVAPPPAAGGAPGAAEDGSVVSPSFAAGYLNNPRPTYPNVSRRLGEQGQVWLLVRVDAHGQPQAVEVQRSSGHQRLDGAAMQAVRGWRFVPAQRGGSAVAAEVRVPINFALEDAL